MLISLIGYLKPVTLRILSPLIFLAFFTWAAPTSAQEQSGPYPLGNFVVSPTNRYGDGALVVDTRTGLAWLNPSVTSGLTFSEIWAGLADGGRFEDFVPENNFVSFFRSAGSCFLFCTATELTDPVLSQRQAAWNSFESAFGVSGGLRAINLFPNPFVYEGEIIYFFGYSAGVSFGCCAYDDVTKGGGVLPASQISGGVWLRYDGIATVPIPEPSTYMLMLAGLLACAAAARRKRRSLS